MTERVIDTLLAVEIQVHDRNTFTGLMCIGEHRGGGLDASLAIRLFGLYIHVRQTLDVLCGCGTLGGVLANDHDVAAFAARKSELVGVSSAVSLGIAVVETALFAVCGCLAYRVQRIRQNLRRRQD